MTGLMIKCLKTRQKSMGKRNSVPSNKKETGKKTNRVRIDLSHKQNEAKSSGGLSIVALGILLFFILVSSPEGQSSYFQPACLIPVLGLFVLKDVFNVSSKLILAVVTFVILLIGLLLFEAISNGGLY